MAWTVREPSFVGMRKLGIAVLGLFSGLLLGLLVTDILGQLVVAADGTPPSTWLGVLLGYTTPVLVVVGVFVALAIDSRVHGGRSK
jgi:Na+-translocating ferredoxin:NAD+ oxidoreductase RnfD subunit